MSSQGAGSPINPTVVNIKISLAFQATTHAYPPPPQQQRSLSSNQSVQLTAPDWQTPDQKMHTDLIETTQRGTVAVDTAAKYSVRKKKLERQMNEHHAEAATLVAINKDPRAANGKLENSFATAEARANRYKAQRDTLRRMHRDRVLSDTKVAESHELKLAKPLKSWVADDGDAIDRSIETIWLCAVACSHHNSLYSIANLRKARKQTVDLYPFLFS